MRRIFFAVSLCCSVPGSTQLAYSQTAGTAAAKNEQPFFGGQVKTAKEKALDDAFVRSSIKAAGNRDLALTELIERGFEAIAQRDPKTAMKRFNQASLINADDYRVYGVSLLRRGSKAISQNRLSSFAQPSCSSPTIRIFCATRDTA